MGRFFPFFKHYPGTNLHEIDLDYVLRESDAAYQQTADLMDWADRHQADYEELSDKVDGLVNHLVNVIVPWDSSVEYPIYSMVEYQGTNYIALKDVPVGVMITNTDYWQPANNVLEQLNAIGQVTQETADRVNYYPVFPQMYGAVGDGETDDSAAFQAAIDYLKSIAPVSRVGNHTTVTEMTLVIPYGKYLINNVDISATALHIKGYGAEIRTNGTAFIVSDENRSRRLTVENLSFVAGACYFNLLGLRNLEATMIAFDRCKFYGATDAAIKYESQSSMLFISRCHFYKNTVALDVESGDCVRVDKCWFNDIDRQGTQTAAIILKGQSAFFTEVGFIPSGTAQSADASENAYINLYGENLTLTRCRASNEQGVTTLVNNFYALSASADINTGITLRDCTHLNMAGTDPVIRLFAMPASINVHNCAMRPLNPPLIGFSATVNAANLVSALWNINGTPNVLMTGFRIDITGIKTRLPQVVKIPDLLIPFAHTDYPLDVEITSTIEASADITVPLPRIFMPVPGMNKPFDLPIHFGGRLAINANKSRTRAFEGTITFDRDSSTLTPIVTLNNPDVSVTCTPVTFQSGAFDASFTISIRSNNASFTEHLLQRFYYSIPW